MTRRVLAILTLSLSTAVLVAGPSRYGFSDRVERHLFPEVTTGPDNPAWSPDGSWIAFSMQGDIWKVPAKGGEAIALTRGPAYYFEPTWSPDGKSIAFTMDTDGNLDVGMVGADGGAITRVTDAREVNLEPTWSRDSQDVFFVSARGGRGFDIFKLHVADRVVTPVVAEPGDQTQPAVSPDGLTLAYVSPVQGKLGTGGIWTRPIAGGPATLVHYEESEYRMRPQWTPDGKALLFDSDDMGSNDVAIVPATGGNPLVITNDPMGEFSPAVSPDGSSFAFVSNRTGPMTLEVAPIGGGPIGSWHEVPVARRRYPVPTGRVHGTVVEDSGAAMPARVEVKASDGRAYSPDGGFARVIAVSETHYFHSVGAFDLEVPAGPLAVEALRGFEYRPATTTVDVKPGATTNVTLTLRRLVDAPATGWYGGDTHAHDLHQGRFGLTHRTLFDQSLAEDLHVTHVLIHMDGTRIMGRWADLTGKPDPLSTPTHIMQFAEEFRGSLGHIGMIGIKNYVLPLTGGENNTAYAQVASDVPYLDGARAQGGLAGYMHPYTRASQNPATPNPAQWDGSLIPVDVALGKGDFYDVASLYSDELGLGGDVLPVPQLWLPPAGNRRHGQFSRRLARPAAGHRSNVRKGHRAAQRRVVAGRRESRSHVRHDRSADLPDSERTRSGRRAAARRVRAAGGIRQGGRRLHRAARQTRDHRQWRGRAADPDREHADVRGHRRHRGRRVGRSARCRAAVEACRRQLRVRANHARVRRAQRQDVRVEGRRQVSVERRRRDLGAGDAFALAKRRGACRVQGPDRSGESGLHETCGLVSAARDPSLSGHRRRLLGRSIAVRRRIL